MAKIGALIEKLFKKAGIDTNTDDLKSVFENETEVSDEIAGKVDKSLLTIEAAKSNADLTKYFRKTILGVADEKIDEVITEFGLQPGEDFTEKTNTYEKIKILGKLAVEAGKKSGSAPDKRTADQWAAKEADYNNQIKVLKETATAKENDYKTSRESDLTSFELQKILLGKDYIFPKEMDNNLKITTALGAVTTELNKKGYSLKRNEAGQLIIVNKEGQPAYSETNEAVEPTTFIDGALAQNKLLKINDSSQQQASGSGGATTVVPGNGVKGNSSIVAEIDAQIAQFN